jgi:ribosome-associated heat shock protein Hsp15
MGSGALIYDASTNRTMNILLALAMVTPRESAATPHAVRVDVWLWAARFFKTRSLAKRAIEAGKITVNDLPCKSSKLLHIGDRVALMVGAERIEIDIAGLDEKRGPASVAQTLYHETEASRIARDVQREQRRLLGLDAAKPPSRPDKRSRRLIHRFLAKKP